MSQFRIVEVPTFDAAPMYTRIWSAPGQPIAALVLLHGMSEHGGRYQDFAEQLAASGIAVYAPDLRGHGRTATDPTELGFFAAVDGWSKVLGDIATLVAAVSAAHPGLPLFLMGHSLGSVLARSYAIEHSNDLAGLMLSGTLPDPGIQGRLGKVLARTLARLRGPKHRSRLLKAATFDAYNRHFAPNRTDFDWLSRDLEQVDNYIADPMCGVNPTVQIVADAIAGTQQVNSLRQVMRMRPDLPVLIAVGDEDPVAKGIEDVYAMFKQAGIFNTTLQQYPGARHEILNETNRDQVRSDLLGWLLAHLPD